MFGVYFHLWCRWSLEAWSKWRISCRRHSEMHCLWTSVNAYSRISSIFVPEGFVNKYWNNCERTIPVVKGNLPGAAQYWPNGNCISVWFGLVLAHVYVHREHTFDIPHSWNGRSIYFSRLTAAMRPMPTRRGSDKDVFRSLKCSCHSGTRMEVTKPIFSVSLIFHFFNYKNTGYLHDIMFIAWQLLQQLSCGDT